VQISIRGYSSIIFTQVGISSFKGDLIGNLEVKNMGIRRNYVGNNLVADGFGKWGDSNHNHISITEYNFLTLFDRKQRIIKLCEIEISNNYICD
jgi:hypothetical protein